MDINPYPGGSVVRTLDTLIRTTRAILCIGRLEPGTRQGKPSGHATLREVDASAVPTVSNPLLQNIFKGLIGFPGIEIYVHGSWADETKTAFSDLDDLIIVDEDAIRSKALAKTLIKRLNRVDMRFCRMDPLQHHGHWIIKKDDLASYDESYIPINVLDGAICVQGRMRISANIAINLTRLGLRRNLERTLSNIIEYHDKYRKNKINVYEMKRYVGSILLIPAYIFQMKGYRVSKRYAIENAEMLFGSDALAAITCCSSIRDHWQRAIGGWHFKLLRLSARWFMNPHIYRMCSSRFSPVFPRAYFPELETKSVNAFVTESRALGDAGSSYGG